MATNLAQKATSRCKKAISRKAREPARPQCQRPRVVDLAPCLLRRLRHKPPRRNSHRRQPATHHAVGNASHNPRRTYSSAVQATTAQGNGAEFSAPPNRRRPLRNQMSATWATWSCHHAVSTRAGNKPISVVTRPLSASDLALATQAAAARNGGFINTLPDQASSSPS